MYGMSTDFSFSQAQSAWDSREPDYDEEDEEIEDEDTEDVVPPVICREV